MAIHEKAAAGYQSAADAYERGRPEYPAEAVEHLCQTLRLSERSRVLDLGAGTGKFTKLLVPCRADIVAVEPVAAMRKKLKEKVPSAVVLEGSAEAIPLESVSVDAVVKTWRAIGADLELPRRQSCLGRRVEQAGGLVPR